MTAAVCFTAAVSGAYAFPQQSHGEPEEQSYSEPEGQSYGKPGGESHGESEGQSYSEPKGWSHDDPEGQPYGEPEEVTQYGGITAVPVNIQSLGDGEYEWLGEYALSEGDTIRYNVSAGTGYHMAIGFIRSKELSPTYFTENNDRSQGILKATGGFEVPADLVGTYTLFVQACDGELTDVKGTVEIGKIADHSAASDEIVTSIPIEIPVLSELTFAWLGEYDFAYGDRIQYHISAEAGSGFKAGLAAKGDDPLNRTYYTIATVPNNDILEISSDFAFSEPVKPGTYKLFIRAVGEEDLENVKGEITITKKELELETVTIKDKTYYMIITKEQLRALSYGQLSLDKDYMLQRDIDLSGMEWIPIGTSEKPFTGSFNGNGCEITGLTMNDPDAKVKGLFGYADGAKIYNVTLRDYDIANGGVNSGQKSTAPVLAFGTDTECYDNFLYPRE